MNALLRELFGETYMVDFIVNTFAEIVDFCLTFWVECAMLIKRN